MTSIMISRFEVNQCYMKQPKKDTSTDIWVKKYIMPLYSVNQFITRHQHLQTVFIAFILLNKFMIEKFIVICINKDRTYFTFLCLKDIKNIFLYGRLNVHIHLSMCLFPLSRESLETNGDQSLLCWRGLYKKTPKI